MNAANFLVSILFETYILIILLRVWLQMARADFYNPMSQFIVKATQPVVGPLRRVIPSLGGLDLACLCDDLHPIRPANGCCSAYPRCINLSCYQTC